MDNYSAFSNFSTTAPPFYQCPELAQFAQWRNTYLTPAVFRNSVAAVAVNALLLLITAPTNALVMFCILVERRFRSNSFMIMLLSLSTTDFLVGCLVQPLFVAWRIAVLYGRPDLVCSVGIVQTVAGVTCLGASLAHTCLISFERYLAVHFPARYRVLLTKRRVKVAVSLIWLFFTVYSVLPVVGYPEVGKLAGRVVMVALIVVVTAVCYIGTFVEPGAKSARLDRHRGARVAPANVPCQTPTEVPRQLSAAALLRKNKEKKLARSMLITVGILAFCYLPEILAHSILPQNREEMGINWIVLSWTKTLLYFNSCVNPFWYCWRILCLRKAVRNLLRFREREMLDENQQPENGVPDRVRIMEGRPANVSGRLSVRQASPLRRRCEVAYLPPIIIILTPARRASVQEPQTHKASTSAKQRSNSL